MLVQDGNFLCFLYVSYKNRSQKSPDFQKLNKDIQLLIHLPCTYKTYTDSTNSVITDGIRECIANH